ncbi:hypothetical protein ABPG73_003606 [Tetrahymena malaccensis]
MTLIKQIKLFMLKQKKFALTKITLFSKLQKYSSSKQNNFIVKFNTSKQYSHLIRYDIRNFQEDQSIIGSSLSNLVNLQNLKILLSYNEIEDEGISILCSTLYKCTNLQKLELFLEKNNIGQKGISSLDKCKNLKILNLQLAFNTNICDDENYDDGSDIFTAIQEFINLQIFELRLIQNKIDDVVALHLGTALKQQINLKNLNMSLKGNQISNEGALSLLNNLAGGSKSLSCLQLNLGGNLINDDGVSALGVPISSMNLIILKLNFEPIVTNAAGLISFLVNCPNISNIALTLSFCSMGDYELISLSSTLEKLINLENCTLNLYGNMIGNIGVQGLTQALETCINLLTLEIFLQQNPDFNEYSRTSRKIRKMKKLIYMSLEF